MIVIFYEQGEWHCFNQEVFYLRSIFEIRILFASTNTRVFVHLWWTAYTLTTTTSQENMVSVYVKQKIQ